MKYTLTKQEIFPFRPKPFFFITTSDKEQLTQAQMEKTLRDMKEKGFGGIVLFNKPQNGFNKDTYLSDAWFSMVEETAKACKALSLPMWINDGFDYPPGDVAGRVQKVAPHLTQKHIKLIDGKLTVLDATWGFPAFEERESTELFIKFVYEEYEKRVGAYFGDPIVGFFSDTDNRRVKPSAMFKKDSPMRDYFPWSVDFEASFKATYGYDIMPYMTEIIQRKDIPQAVDYWEYAGRLMQGWFRAHRDWLHSRGLEYTGHSSDSSPYLYDEAPRSSCFTEGRFSDAQSIFDYPGTDQELYALDGGKHMIARNYYTPHVIWGEEEYMPKMSKFSDITEDLRAKQTAATAFLYGKKGVMCEMFAATNYGVEPATLKRIAAYQIMQGVTFVVPHAYHYRFTGATKYFAPPDFSSASMLDHSVKELNDWLAEKTCLMAKGTSVFPIALIDPTEYVWRGVYDEKEYFSAFAKLNRLPYGFTICDTRRLLSKDYGFKVAIAAGIAVDEATKQALAEKGIVVLGEKDIENLANYLVCDVSYEGEGTPHFLRKIIDGKEFTFIANIENDEPICGTIKAYGREKKLVLYPGDIRYISAEYDDIPPVKAEGERVAEFPKIAKVTFDAPNILPLEYFKDGEETVLKTEESETLCFPFTAKDTLTDLKLYIPLSANDILTGVVLDGKALAAEKGKVFDEPYLTYTFHAASGEHCLEIKKKGAFKPYERIFIEGDFDTDVQTDKTEYKRVYTIYNAYVYVPKTASVAIAKRRSTLRTDCSWALQGQPFYSGGVTYSFPLTVKEGGVYGLKLGKVRDVAVLYVNGKKIGKLSCPPYDFTAELQKGENEIAVTVYNSMANAMECYLEKSGLLETAYLEK